MPPALVGIGMRASSQDGDVEPPVVGATLSKVTQERLKAREQPRIEKVRQRKLERQHSNSSDSQGKLIKVNLFHLSAIFIETDGLVIDLV